MRRNIRHPNFSIPIRAQARAASSFHSDKYVLPTRLHQKDILYLVLTHDVVPLEELKHPGVVDFESYTWRHVGCKGIPLLENPMLENPALETRPDTQGDTDFLLEQGEDRRSDSYAAASSLAETLDLLERYKQNYAGTTRRGIEAMELQLQGMRLTDIAKQYDVPPNHVGAWISRAASKLREETGLREALLE